MLPTGLNANANVLVQQQQQQQQQHSLLSQASWGRLEMKPKRDENKCASQLQIMYNKVLYVCMAL
jgi:hypothetical protein